MRVFIPIFLGLTFVAIISAGPARAEGVYRVGTVETYYPRTPVESASMRLCPPMGEVTRTYVLPDSPIVSTGAITTVSAPVVIESRLLPPRLLEDASAPSMSINGDLKPLLPRASLADPTADPPGSQAALPEQPSGETDGTVDDPIDNPFEGIMKPRNFPRAPVVTTVSKPETPKPKTAPPPPVSPVSLEPLHLGQAISRNPVEEAMSEMLPYPEGPVDAGEIDSKLLESATAVPPINPVTPPVNKDDSKQTPQDGADAGAGKEQWVSGALLLTTIIATMVACYAVVLAFEFRQRWMQTVTEQNSRFSMGIDDDFEAIPGLFEPDFHFEGSRTTFP